MSDDHPEREPGSALIPDHVHIAHLIERLMDADLLFPEEGAALLREIEAASREGEVEEPENLSAQTILEALSVLAQPDCCGAAARQAALEAVRVLLHSRSAPASPPQKPGS